MRMYDLIQKKKRGEVLTDAEIAFFVDGYAGGMIPDYQASALCMAIWFRGMTAAETTALTLAMRDSGKVLCFDGIDGVRVDKHSTGGVGDKTSLIVAPIVASLGLKVAKMSGRGLGHTGGTVDKLESFTGFRTELSLSEFERIVNEHGLAIVGQSGELAPADKLLYALRDVTATVDSMPLIASSIMSKKLAADDDCIVLDVKCGSGAFMKTVDESIELAEMMVEIGKRAGKRMAAMVTDMDSPLGLTIGNALEVEEAIETLRGNGPSDLTELCTALAVQMLVLAEKGDAAFCASEVARVIQSGEALERLARMVAAQGGDRAMVDDPKRLPHAQELCVVTAPCSGYIASVDAEGYGIAALLLGAGRNTKEDVIDMTAGIRLHAKTGDYVAAGEPIATLYSADATRFGVAKEKLLESTVFGASAPEKRPLILKIIQ
ncbi:MAG: thymidine phosphorylase [Ruminococcaceae bacterium]|nr:thymidine phosphorylase [Oscillospiraceae bacterium]